MNVAAVIIGVTTVILTGGIGLRTRNSGEVKGTTVGEVELVSRSGLHWHPKLEIYIKGEKVELEDGIGLGVVEKPMHTHTEDYREGVVHMEFSGRVTAEQTRLGNFFDIWGKKFSSSQLFDRVNGDEGVVRMKVNGIENTEYENYEMKDTDRIEIRFE